MVFKYVCVLVLLTKVASALEGLKLLPLYFVDMDRMVLAAVLRILQGYGRITLLS